MMKKLIAVLCISMLIITAVPLATMAKENPKPGGVPAFLIGCCFGLRVGTMWNEGVDLHWREWAVIIPYAGIIIAIWNGVDCYKGMTAHQWAEQNGANWY